MKIRVSDIIYDDKTVEWNITIDSLSGYMEYRNNPVADQSVWTFGDFTETKPSDSFCIDVPFSDFMSEIDKIYAYVEDYISKKTYKKVKKMKISEII